MTMSISAQSNTNFFTLMAACVLLTIAMPAWAVTAAEVDELVQSDPATGDLFAVSYAIDGDTVILGAFLDDDVPNSSGSAYVYVRNTAGDPCPVTGDPDPWCQQAKLAPSDQEAFEWFGYAVSVSGDTAVVTARRDDNDGDDGASFEREGSAYVFVRSGSTWNQQAKLRADDLSEDPWFGTHADIEGDTLVIGARKDDQKGTDAGAVYVFTRTAGAWSQQAKLMASDGAAFDFFGTFVSLDGNTLAIGAHLNDDDGDGSGSAYIFVRDGTSWSQQAKLTADDAAADDLFGIRLALSGNKVLIGAPTGTGGPGAAYVFHRVSGVWTQEAKLTASDGFAGDGYGFTVGLSDNVALVGADTDDDDGLLSGSVYLYVLTPTGWSEETKLLASNGAADNWFGSGIDFSGDSAVIAALPFGITFIGSAYVLEFDLDDDGIRDALDNCPITYNPGQGDANGNDIGNECDIGATQTYSDGGTPTLEGAVQGGCVDCIANGWTVGGEGDIVSGEDGPSDNALLFSTSGGNFHFLSWRLYKFKDTRVLGDLEAANAAGIRFRAKHGGGTDNIVLKALMADPFDDNGSDFAISNTSVTIEIGSDWDTYDISLVESNLTLGTLLFDPFGFIPPRRTASEIRSNVAQFGLRHTPPGNMGPGDPAPTASMIVIDDIRILLDGDGDGVYDPDDNCPSTTLPETVVPTTGQLGKNKWALQNADGTFVQAVPQDGSKFSFDIADTRGCTCEQIIEAAGLGSGQAKNGCSTGVMLNWINNP